MKFAEEQPIEGETVLFCAHEAVALDVFQGVPGTVAPNQDRGRMHFFRTRGMPFKSPGGDAGTATWIIICHECYESGRINERFMIGGHGTWQGNTPVIRAKKGGS